MTTDPLAATALDHYAALIAARYPPQLAAAIAAATYAHGLAVGPSLPALRAALVVAAETYPEIKRDVGRTLAAIDRRDAA